MYDYKYHNQNLEDYSFLVTGGAGFIGSNLVKYLLKYKAKKVRVLDNLSNGYIENLKEFFENELFEFIEGDIRDYNTCLKALEGIDYVSHQAALGSVPRSIKDPITTNEVNITGALNMFHAVKENGAIKRMVYAASSSSYGDSTELPKVEGYEGVPLSPYAVSKLVNELYADVYSKVYDLHTIGLRYFNVFGPNQNPNNPYAAVIPLFLKSALDQTVPTIFGDGLTSRDFTYIENAVQANIKALLDSQNLARHEVVNIAVGERTTLNELWEIITQLCGIEIKPNYADERPGDVRHSLANIEKAKNLIDYHPKFTVKDGLKVTIDRFKK